ncbi:MAG: excinuclease ABC subunit UvrC [Eubacteriales bacterium]|jgi:excinuclease ABC subunit C
MRDQKRTEYLLDKANSLPACPGIYIMRDKGGRVIYVGKSRKLKNRVSQYFQAGEKDPKTERMASLVWDFEVVICSNEIEALMLENSFIKQYAPKYNIKLKDAKSYPYIKITSGEYPRLVCTRRREDDGAKYYGPYSSTSTVYSVIGAVNKALRLPSCSRNFPRDIGRGRPCIYYQMGRCCGVCTGKVSREEYDGLIRNAAHILSGNTQAVKRELAERMKVCAEEERFEEAARCRDIITALDRLREKQKVVFAPGEEADVFALYDGGDCAAVSVLSVRDGVLSDKSGYPFGAGEIADAESMSAFICGYYRARDFVPSRVLLSFPLDEEANAALTACLSEIAGRSISVTTPQRGEAKGLCELALANAAEVVREYRESVRKDESILLRLAEILGLETYPARIEAYDVSNIGGEHMRCGMIVVADGKFKKGDYRSFAIRGVAETDDYAAMSEAISRRLARLGESTGSFSELPDLILLDGGRGHVSTIRRLLEEKGLEIPVFGMVKDEHHKTRALCTDTGEINIAKERQVFMLIYRIQEEVHRFTSAKTAKAKRKTLKKSLLTEIPGIGEKKAKLLLEHFGGLAAIKKAGESDIAAVKGISKRDAEAVYNYFHK